jgi:alpha-galactosidase
MQVSSKTGKRGEPHHREVVAIVDGQGRTSPLRGSRRQRLGDLEVAVTLNDHAGGVRVDWSVRNPTRGPVVLDRFGLDVATPDTRVLEHGWQSWSGARRCERDDVRRQRRGVPRWRRAMLMADPDAAGRAVFGDQFLLDESGITGFLSAASHFGTAEAGCGSVRAWALLDGAVLPAGAERVLDPLWIAQDEAGPVYSRFVDLWAHRSSARTTGPSRSGWCSWYRYFNSVTPSEVRAAASHCLRRGLEVVQIDDGYQPAVGDWTSPSPSWPEGPGSIGRELAGSGLVAGIWTAPFLAGPGAPILRDNPDWLVRDGRGRPVGAIHHPGVWGGWAYTLDTTAPEVLDHIRHLYSALVDDGFTYHKLDFLYAGALAGRRHDPTVTRAEALRTGLDAVREATGEDAFLLACGCPFGPAVGVVDAMRVSTDIQRRWQEPSAQRGFAESQSGLRNSVEAVVMRAPMHRRLWINDPDCVLLEAGADGLSENHRALMADVVAGTGGFTILSDDLGSYDEDQWRTVERLVESSRADGPLDLIDPFADSVAVRSPVAELEVDWRGDGSAKLVLAESAGRKFR